MTVTQNQAAVTGTSGDPTVSVTFPLTPEQAAEAEAMAKHSAYLDSICATLPIDGSLVARRPNGTGCPRASKEANGAAPSSDVEGEAP